LKAEAGDDVEKQLDIETGELAVRRRKRIGLGIAHRADADHPGLDQVIGIVGGGRRACAHRKKACQKAGPQWGEGGHE